MFPRSSDPQSKLEPWIDALILIGDAIVLIVICAAAVAAFHDRHLPIRGTAPSVSIASSATSHSSP